MADLNFDSHENDAERERERRARFDADVAEAMMEIEKRERYLNKFQGCLVGGAVGDALGYAVEFLPYSSIVKKYGPHGIVSYDLPHEFAVARISDDTQMTLFTLNGILVGSTRYALRGHAGNAWMYAYRAYLDWLATQDPSFDDNPVDCWLLTIPELHKRRAPGHTCMSALASGNMGEIDSPINSSKGCGSVMRVAPWGLYGNREQDPDYSLHAEVSANMAAVTHGHPLGWIPAAALSFIVNKCCYCVPEDEELPAVALRRIVMECADSLGEWFPDHPDHVSIMVRLLHQAIELADNDEEDDHVNISRLGEGWVAEEALAIAVYAAIRYGYAFDDSVIAAVNHDGDSDSTGAICGNIVGALLGYRAISEKWTCNLELHDLIMELAKDLCDDCRMDEYSSFYDAEWMAKYGRSCMGSMAMNDMLRQNVRYSI